MRIWWVYRKRSFRLDQRRQSDDKEWDCGVAYFSETQTLNTSFELQTTWPKRVFRIKPKNSRCMGDQHSANTRFTTPVMSDPIRENHQSGYHNLRGVFHQQGQHRHADMDLSIAWDMSWNLGRYIIPLPAPGKPPKETCRNLWIWNLGSRPAWLLMQPGPDDAPNPFGQTALDAFVFKEPMKAGFHLRSSSRCLASDGSTFQRFRSVAALYVCSVHVRYHVLSMSVTINNC